MLVESKCHHLFRDSLFVNLLMRRNSRAVGYGLNNRACAATFEFETVYVRWFGVPGRMGVVSIHSPLGIALGERLCADSRIEFWISKRVQPRISWASLFANGDGNWNGGYPDLKGGLVIIMKTWSILRGGGGERRLT